MNSLKMNIENTKKEIDKENNKKIEKENIEKLTKKFSKFSLNLKNQKDKQILDNIEENLQQVINWATIPKWQIIIKNWKKMLKKL